MLCSSWIQTWKTGDQPYSDTYPKGECSLLSPIRVAVQCRYAPTNKEWSSFLVDVIFKKWANPGLLLFIFDLFKQTSLQILQQIHVKKCPSRKRCGDSNPQPLKHESPPITTRPGLPLICCHLVNNSVSDSSHKDLLINSRRIFVKVNLWSFV